MWGGEGNPDPGRDLRDGHAPTGWPPLRLMALAVLAGSWGVCLQLRGSADAFAWVLAVAAWAALVSAASRGRGGLTLAAWSGGLAAVVVAGAAAFIGRTPLVIAYVSTVVASTALARCQVGAHRASVRGGSVTVLAVPFLVLAQANWARTTSVRVTLALIVLAYGLVELARRRPASYERMEDAGRRGIAAVGTAVALVILFVVAGIFLYLPGFVMRAARSVRDRTSVPAAAAWEPYRSTRFEEMREASHLFATTPRPVTVRRHVAAAGLVLVAVAASTIAVEIARDDDAPPRAASSPRPVTPDVTGSTRTEPNGEPIRRSLLALEYATSYTDLPAYRGVPWADLLQALEREDLPPANPYYNLDEGLRRTRKAPVCRCPSASIWLVGGSAAHGIGQRDDHTIASELVSLGEEAGWSLEVTNLASPGAHFRFQLDMLKLRIEAVGAPDLVIFYNGFNEVVYEVAHRFAVADGAPSRRTDPYADIDHFNERLDAFLASEVAEPAATWVIADYRAAMSTVERLAEETGFATGYFFQPDAFVGAAQLRGYDSITGLRADEMLSSPLAEALRLTAQALEPPVHDLRGVFVGVQAPMFLGIVHQNEAGARIVAEEMFDVLRPQLATLVGRPGP